MLNPAGAIVQAIRAIYNGIMFFMDNAERIKDLVAAITNSIADIAAGKIGTAAKYITDSLIRTIPIVLSFLSHLLKLNKITEVLRKAVDKVRKPIEKAIKKGVKWLVKKVKGWLKKAKNFFSGKGKDGKPKKVAETSGEDKAKHDGTDAEVEGKASNWINIRETFEDEEGHVHTLFFKGDEENAQLMVASVPKKVNDFIKETMGKFSNDEKKVVQDEIITIDKSETTIETNVRKLRNGLSDKSEDKSERIITQEVKSIQQQFIEFFSDAKNLSEYPAEVQQLLLSLDGKTKAAIKKELKESKKEPIGIQNNAGEGNNVAKNKASIYIQNHSGSGDNILTETASLFIQQNHTGSGDNVANGNTSKYIQQNHSGSGDNVGGEKVMKTGKENDNSNHNIVLEIEKNLTYVVKETFHMLDELHTLTLTVKNGELESFTIASKVEELKPAVKRMIKEVETNFKGREKQETLDLLNEVLNEVNDAEPYVNNSKEFTGARVNNNHKDIRKLKEKLIKKRLAVIANLLYHVSEKTKIRSLTDFKAFYHSPPAERYLPGYPSQNEVGKFIRGKIYGMFDWEATRKTVYNRDYQNIINAVNDVQKKNNMVAWNILMKKGIIEKGAVMGNYDPTKIEYQVDHDTEVTMLWYDKGHKCDDNERKKHFLDKNNLRLVTRQYNLSGKYENTKKPNYDPLYVAPSFTSKLAEGGLKNAGLINNMPFLDASGQPIKK